jgi:hypothetical protein
MNGRKNVIEINHMTTGLFVDQLTFARMTAATAFQDELAAVRSRTSDGGDLLDKWYRLCVAGQAEVAALESRLEKARAAQIENSNAGTREMNIALSNQAIADARRDREAEV